MGVIDANWNYKINLTEIEINFYNNFELEFNDLRENFIQVLEDGFLIENINYQSNLAITYDEKLKLLTEDNKELKQKIDMKLKELSKQQAQYEKFKKDQKLLAQQIKETHEAFLMAKKYYKKFLKIYYSIETRNNKTQVIFVQFFVEAKKDTENYSARLTRNSETGRYELQSVNPKLKIIKELQRKLEESNDVPGALCCLRQAFMAIKEGKKKRNDKNDY